MQVQSYRKLATILLATTITLTFQSFVHAKSARQIAADTFPSVMLLVMEDANGQPLSLGSGFSVRECIIASNIHVIDGAAGGYAKVIGRKKKYEIEGVVGVDIKRDLALLAVRSTEIPQLTLGDSSRVAVGQEVYVVGNPQGLEGTFSKGIVSGIRQVGTDTLLQITAPISTGSSGGPVLDSDGKVIGVAIATFKGGQNLNFAIPVSYLKELISDIQPIRPLSPKPYRTKQKSILDELGEKITEAIIGVQMTWDSYSKNGKYSFSLRNKLRDSVKDIYCLVVFYDSSGNPLDIDVIHHSGVIPGGLARRVKSSVDESVERLNTKSASMPPRRPQGRVDFRILDFNIVK